MLSNSCFYNDTVEFFKYYKANFNCLSVLPNSTHKFIKKLEDMNKQKAAISFAFKLYAYYKLNHRLEDKTVHDVFKF